MVEGTKSVLELLHSELLVEELVAQTEWLEQHQQAIKQVSASIATDEQMERMTSFKTAPPVLAIARIPVYDRLPQTGWIIALDGINDPGNLGTMIRIADWYGIKNIVCSADTVDHFNPKAVASSMGSFARVQVHYTDLSKYLKTSKLQVFACVMDGESVYHVKADEGIVLVGSESHGISRELVISASKKITIPVIGKAESLNAAVAMAIVCDRLIGHPL